jgi:hypothetical protein
MMHMPWKNDWPPMFELEPGIFFRQFGFYGTQDALSFLNSDLAYQKITIPKRNGKLRIVYKPHDKTEAMQRAIKPLLDKLYYSACEVRDFFVEVPAIPIPADDKRKAWNLRIQFPDSMEFIKYLKSKHPIKVKKIEEECGKDAVKLVSRLFKEIYEQEEEYYYYFQGCNKNHPFKKVLKYYGPVTLHASRALAGEYLLKCDIQNFYPSIKANKLYKVLTEAPYKARISQETAAVIVAVATHKKRLVQGSCISPVLANIYMFYADYFFQEKMYSYCKINNYSRYVDDLIFTSMNPMDVNATLEVISKELSKLGLKLHPRKIKYLKPHEKKIVTGMVVNEKRNVDRRYIRRIRAILHDIEHYGVALACWHHQGGALNTITEEDEKKFILKIQGMIAWVMQVRGADDVLANKLKSRWVKLKTRIT